MASVLCQDCGTPNSRATKFCIECGTQMSAPAEPAAPLVPAFAAESPLLTFFF
jgi:hypothetical protein